MSDGSKQPNERSSDSASIAGDPDFVPAVFVDGIRVIDFRVFVGSGVAPGSSLIIITEISVALRRAGERHAVLEPVASGSGRISDMAISGHGLHNVGSCGDNKHKLYFRPYSVTGIHG